MKLKSTTKKQLIGILFATLIIFSAEIAFRALYDLDNYVKLADSFLIIFFIVACLRFMKYKTMLAIALLYTIISYASQMINMAVYGYWLPPVNIVLMFEKASEAFNSGRDSLGTVLPALAILILISTTLFYSAYHRVKSHKAYTDILFVIFILFQPAKNYLSPSKTLGETPSSRYSAIKAGYYTNGYLLGRVLPDMVTGKDYYQEYQSPRPTQLRQNKIKNIIIVMGESLNTANISSFGYTRDTSPWLNEISSKSEVLLKETYSSGTFTDITLPSFFNMIPTPNGDKQIASRNTNILRMAKENGYTTHFHSAQNEDGMTLMNKVGLEFIDNYTLATDLGYDHYNDAYDDEIIDYLDDIDFNKSNLIILHQRGSHSPYTHRVPKDFKPFGTGNYQNDYDNTVFYTDRFLEKSINKLDSLLLDDNWVFIFTSDHGQTVTPKTMGGGSLNIESDYIVPSLLIAKNESIIKKYQDSFKNCDRIFHYQLSSYIGRKLGFDIKIPDCSKGIVNGSRMNGSAGYLEITQ